VRYPQTFFDLGRLVPQSFGMLGFGVFQYFRSVVDGRLLRLLFYLSFRTHLLRITQRTLGIIYFYFSRHVGRRRSIGSRRLHIR